MTGAQYLASLSPERLEELITACDQRLEEILEDPYGARERRELRAERLLYASELGRR